MLLDARERLVVKSHFDRCSTLVSTQERLHGQSRRS
jgi:hypothetical protein